MTNIAAYIETVATHYWGQPKERRGHELALGQPRLKECGDLRKGTWFDFENNCGGGVIDLVRANEGAGLKSLPDIMEQWRVPKQVQDKLTPAKYISKVYEYYDEHGE